MKLVDILARELKAWPEGWDDAGQSESGRLHVVTGWEPSKGRTYESYTQAEDWASAVVTRAEWQAAVEALKAEQAAELKWPDGAEFMGTTDKGCPKVFYRNVGGATYEYLYVENGRIGDWRLQHGNPAGQPLIPRPTESAVEWDGVSIPSTGTGVEVRFACEKSRAKWLWHTGVVVASGNQPEGGEIVVVEVDGFTVALRNTADYIRPIRTQEKIAAEEREKAIQEIANASGLRARDGRIEVATAIYDAGYRKQPK